MNRIALQAIPLTAAAFKSFGDVLGTEGAYTLINDGTTLQFPDLAQVDVLSEGGRPRVSIYRATPYATPLSVLRLERHPLSSQLFMPLSSEPFLVIVGEGEDAIVPSCVRAFVTNGHQGINYHRGTWHHPVLALGREAEFLVIDREGSGDNCEEFFFPAETGLILDYPPLSI